MLHGDMMNDPLVVTSFMKHAARCFRHQEIVSRSVEGPIHRYTYADSWRRMGRLANVLTSLGVVAGDRIATLAWNTHRHFELYYAVAGIGAVCHTINPRLSPAQLDYIVNHAADRFVFVDLTFVPLLESLLDRMPNVEGFVVLTDRDTMPDTRLPNALCYEDLLATAPESFDWPQLDENTAAMLCYTSGTTGNPKGALYSHRSTVLHALCANASFGPMSLNERDAFLVVVPMFHVCAWGTPFMAPMCGAKLVFPGPGYDGPSLFELMDGDRVTLTAGVPTIVTTLLDHMREVGRKPNGLKNMLCGGSAPPESLIRAFEEEFGVCFVQGWGMTEISPVGALNLPSPQYDELDDAQRYALKRKNGRACFGIEAKIIADDGSRLPEDGETTGELAVRGPYVIARYYQDQDATAAAFDTDGWLLSGDVASIDPDGFIALTDRKKDLIKSGGEWISSIDLENAVMAHPGVAEAAAIACSHPKWQERPLLVIRAADGGELSKSEIVGFLSDKVPKWWLPDDVVFVEELPHGATGKVSKVELRRQFEDYRLPTA